MLRLLPLAVALFVPMSEAIFFGGGNLHVCLNHAYRNCHRFRSHRFVCRLCHASSFLAHLLHVVEARCGRKKRSTPVVSRHHEEPEANLCNNPQIRKIILTNITEDPVASKVAIHSELKAKLHGNYVVMCSSRVFSFVADTISYCVEGTETNTCMVIES
ncbi:Ground-like domain-containing protein [Aphelenchoides bicaudatus]|nr:Ground-like domain-containing protein [Aphelenchoides bicaudatus]